MQTAPPAASVVRAMRRIRMILLTGGLLVTTALTLICVSAASASTHRPPVLSRSAIHKLWMLERRARRSPRGSVPPIHLSPPAVNRAIIGGSSAAQGTWGFMAFVAHFDSAGNPDFACTGTVISSNLVLTAGHCAADETTGLPLDPGGYAVVTGSVDWTNSTLRQVSPVSRVIVYPSFSPSNLTADAALLQLAQPTTAPSVRLPASTDAYLYNPGTYALIAGWGVTSSGTLPFVLQWASTTVQSAAYCGQHDTIFSSPWETCAIQAPGFSTATCNGDSGGPLIAANTSSLDVEIGIISYGPADCNTSTIDVYTRADAISSWATGWINATTPPPPPTTTTPTPPSTTTTTAPTSTPPPSMPQLPTMSLSDARSFVRTTLRDAFPRTFIHAHQYLAKCSRVSKIRFTCGVRYWSGPNDYWGRVAVFYELISAKVYWSDSYNVRWVNDQCYVHSGHPRRCRIHHAHGSV
jgi:trypsin